MRTITIEIPADWLREEKEVCIRVVGTADGNQRTKYSVEHRADNEKNKAAQYEVTLKDYTERLVSRFRSEGRARLTETYASTLRCFARMMGTADLPLSSIARQVVQDYERRMLDKGLTRNTTSFYLRIVRAIYNRAVAEGLVDECRPFANVFTGKAKTRKRALPVETLRQIAGMELQNDTEEAARRLFMFSFYTRGMSFVDMALLTKDNLRNGKLTYHRQKTGQLLTMAWHPEMQAMSDLLPSKDGIHLLGIIDDTQQRPWRKQCHARQQSANEALKHIGERLQLRHPLTMYVARHSWASVAKQLHVPLSLISDGMGHNSERTTQIYLGDIDGGELDKADDLLIKVVNGKRSDRQGRHWPAALS